MKKTTLLFFPIGLLFVACGGENTETDENTGTDTTEVVSTDTTSTEDEGPTYDGVVKGDYTLYGYTDIEPAGMYTVEEMMKVYDETGEFNDKVSVCSF